jgi:hypothetical protein
MPPSGECPCRIASAAAMVNNVEKKNTNKTQLLASVLTVAQGKKTIKSRDPTGTLYYANPYATSQVGDISYILNFQM